MYERFEKLCKRKGVSVAQVSRATGITEATLSRWKNRSTGFLRMETLITLADYFSCSLDYLCGRVEE